MKLSFNNSQQDTYTIENNLLRYSINKDVKFSILQINETDNYTISRIAYTAKNNTVKRVNYLYMEVAYYYYAYKRTNY